MGIFYKMLMEEVEPEDVIQTADDVGNELDAIAKAVEEEREEMTDRCFCDDDCEACDESLIMFESEYNMNQIMQRIGIVELSEFHEGRDFVLEGANRSGMIAKVVDALKSAWETICRIFSTTVQKLTTVVASDKTLWKKYSDKIEAGHKVGGWTVEGCDVAKVSKTIEDLKDHADTYEEADDITFNVPRCMMAATGHSFETEEELDELLAGMYAKAELTAKDISVATIQTGLTNDCVKDLKGNFTKMKKYYAATIKRLEKKEKDEGIDIAVLSNQLKEARYINALMSKCFKERIKAAKAVRATTRRVALACIKAADAKPAQESTRLFNFD